MIDSRTIVMDIDNTISIHQNRDYNNAIPVSDVIKKTNELYDLGWKIIYFTARGMASCNGDVKLIKKNNEDILVKWLKKHNVKYTELMFGKPLGIYYVDDKALRPNEFVNLKVEKLLGGSFSDVERIGNRVIKKGGNLKNQYLWYQIAENYKFRVPQVFNYYDDTLDLEFIEGHTLNDVAGIDEIDKLTQKISELSEVPIKNENDWSTMISKVKDHLSLNTIENEQEILKIIEDIGPFMNNHKSFMHGDFTLSNLILSGEQIVMIDPNYSSKEYSSYILDYSKIYQSLHYNYEGILMGSTSQINKVKLFEYFENILCLQDTKLEHVVRVCEIIHYIRMLKYKNEQDKSIVKWIIRSLYNEIK